MASPHSNYETLYGVHLLDDLHNFFPALLYDSSSFRSVQDVLGYIQRQSRARFDLFSYGLREYLSTHQVNDNLSSNRQHFGRSLESFNALHTLGQVSSSILPPSQPVSIQVNIADQHEDNSGSESDDESSQHAPPPIRNRLSDGTLTNLLVDLLSSSRDLSSFTSRNMLIPILTQQRSQFLEPVVVRPTPEQIERATTVGNVASDQDIACSICQDNLQPDQEGRKLNACGHWFHKTCIDTWFERAVHCPVCRHDIREANNQESNTTTP